MTIKTATSALASARLALLKEAYGQLLRQLELLALELAMESGPYPAAAANLAASLDRTRENVRRMADAARLLSDVTEPIDSEIIELQRIAERLQQYVIAPLQRAASQHPQAAKAAFRTIRDAVLSLLEDCESRAKGSHTIDKVITAVDLAHYSDLASNLQASSGVEAISLLNKRIERMLKDCLHEIQLSPEQSLIETTGDGAILALRNAEEAHEFAKALFGYAQEANRSRPKDLHFNFRIGVSSGPVVMEPPTIIGQALADAVRLESVCRAGEVIMSESTWTGLPKRIRNLYGPSELIPGKHNERIAARRLRLVPADAGRAFSV